MMDLLRFFFDSAPHFIGLVIVLCIVVSGLVRIFGSYE